MLKSEEKKPYEKILFITEEDSLTEEEIEDIIFNINETNWTSNLYDACKRFQNQDDFTDLQKNFVKEFCLNYFEGLPNYDRISNIINQMSEEEFNTKGIRECCLIYAVEQYIYNCAE